MIRQYTLLLKTAIAALLLTQAFKSSAQLPKLDKSSRSLSENVKDWIGWNVGLTLM